METGERMAHKKALKLLEVMDIFIYLDCDNGFIGACICQNLLAYLKYVKCIVF